MLPQEAADANGSAYRSIAFRMNLPEFTKALVNSCAWLRRDVYVMVDVCV